MNVILIHASQMAIIALLLIVLLALILLIIWLLLRVRQLQALLQSQPIYPVPEPKNPDNELHLDAIETEKPVVADESNSKDEDPLSNQRWVTLVEECIDLYDELDRHFANFDSSRQELADHISLRLQEILERSGVEIIDSDTTFDGHRHRPEQAGIAVAPGTAIAETLSPGFAIEPRVLRRAKVRLAEISL